MFTSTDIFICLFTSSLSRFKDDQQTAFPSSLRDSDAARQFFLKLLIQQIQDSVVFEGPDGYKNLALDSQGMNHYMLVFIYLFYNFFFSYIYKGNPNWKMT